jgi:hypothetical protein
MAGDDVASSPLTLASIRVLFSGTAAAPMGIVEAYSGTSSVPLMPALLTLNLAARKYSALNSSPAFMSIDANRPDFASLFARTFAAFSQKNFSAGATSALMKSRTPRSWPSPER